MSNYPKDQARELARSRLGLLSPEEFQKKNDAVIKNLRDVLFGFREDHETSSVLLYKAIKKWQEVDVSSLENDIQGLIFDYAPQGKGGPFPAKPYDCIFVPLLAINDEGYRLGRGGGWYDRFLSLQPQAFKVGVGIELSKIEFIPESHDIPMDCIVTEMQYKILRKRSHLH